jgi:hypothetical protein
LWETALVFGASERKLACKMPDNQEAPTQAVPAPQVLDVPQFATAEYAHIPGTERCRICGNLIAGEYFRVNSQMACGKCAAEAREGQPTDSHAAFARALLLGIVAALAGLILFATVIIVTGWSIGYLALAVGWLVAKGMMKGSNGMGGRRYQIAALVLTYLAISMSSVPILISYAIKNSPAINWGAAAGQLALWGIASPFLELRDPVHGMIGLVILFVGLSIAFRMTAAKPLDVDGPYKVHG